MSQIIRILTIFIPFYLLDINMFFICIILNGKETDFHMRLGIVSHILYVNLITGDQLLLLRFLSSRLKVPDELSVY